MSERGTANPAPQTSGERARREAPSATGGRSWWAVIRRTVREFQADNLTDWAAALTYYGILALFPALVCLVALVGLFGQYPRTVDALLRIASQIGAGSAGPTLTGAL